MKYQFDTIRNPWLLSMAVMFNILVPIFLWGFLRTPDYKEIIPDFLYQNNIIPILLFIIPIIYFSTNRKKLFWKKIDLSLDEENKKISINSKHFNLEKIEYYEFLPGNQISSGTRDYLIIKFPESKKIKIIPCKSSGQISNYDDFVQGFLLAMETIHPENKEKLISKTIKVILLIILLTAITFYIYFYYSHGSSNAFKMLPTTLIAISVFLPFIFKRFKKPRL